MITPQEATALLLDVSATERGIWRTCRRRWRFTTMENLTGRVPTLAYDFGTGIHGALEEYYKRKSIARALAVLSSWYEQESRRLDKEDMPELTRQEVQDELFDLYQLGIIMLENYPKWEKDSKVDLGKVLAIEGKLRRGSGLKANPPYPQAPAVVRNGRLMVPIIDPHSGEPGPRVNKKGYGGPFLTGTIDLLTERKTPKKGIWIVDHKTDSGSTYSDDGLDYDDQITAYCYMVWRWLGIIPRGVVLNVLVKKAPKEPRLVRDGQELSTAKDQLTTAEQYLEACYEFGHMQRKGGQILSEKHEECYEGLKARGWDPFYRRFEAMRSEIELKRFEERLHAEYIEMVGSVELPEVRLYPNFSPWNCPRCPVKQICRAMEDGSDWEDVRDTQFREDRDRKAVTV